ncbi:hypothetical protein CEXT_154841 [Caerostris extrusa]|uniref:Uncharacterized protein n=1 Tax=Caerostris extrusa TaxID=172846 RepID=A0AAV4X7P1_CAEEX|nr:hypothetical protein CEXT_154841 [Caerostris extrusa]
MNIFPHTSEVPSSLHLACEVIQKMQTGDLFEDVPYLSFRSAKDGDEHLEREDHTCSTLLKSFAVTCRSAHALPRHVGDIPSEKMAIANNKEIKRGGFKICT